MTIMTDTKADLSKRHRDKPMSNSSKTGTIT